MTPHQRAGDEGVSRNPRVNICTSANTGQAPWLIRAATAALWLLCTGLLLLPKPWILFWHHNIPEEYGFGQGIEHIYMFGTLGCFVELSRRKWHPFTWLSVLIAYGLATEILQHFIPPRTCDIADFSQDCAGAYLGIMLGLIVKKVYGFYFARWNSRKRH